MGLRGRLRHVEKAARGRLAWLDLPDGSTFYYDPQKTSAALFLFAGATLRAVRQGDPLPEPPEILKVVGGLPTPEDRKRAFEEVHGFAGKPFGSYDPKTLLQTGEIVADSHLKRPGDEKPPPDEPDEDVTVVQPRSR